MLLELGTALIRNDCVNETLFGNWWMQALDKVAVEALNATDLQVLTNGKYV